MADKANELWDEMIAEIMEMDVENMGYSELVKLALAYQDVDELKRWEAEGEYAERSEQHEIEYGVAYPIRPDSPEKVKQAYERLCKIEKKAAEEGIILD